MTREEATKIFQKEIECLSHTKCEDCILEEACDPIKTTPYDSEYIEAYEMAIKALDQQPCEDCISREEVCDYIAEFVNHEYATDREREMVKHIIGGIQHLPSIRPTAKENLVVGDCISREFIEIVVEYPPADLCTYPEYKGKPYFSIKYRENGKYIIGYGSYKIEMISQWIKQYFISDVQPKTDILGKIRAEIKEESRFCPLTEGLERALEIIDKYKAESEDNE